MQNALLVISNLTWLDFKQPLLDLKSVVNLILKSPLTNAVCSDRGCLRLHCSW
jgi:hypothetical protein